MKEVFTDLDFDEDLTTLQSYTYAVDFKDGTAEFTNYLIGNTLIAVLSGRRSGYTTASIGYFTGSQSRNGKRHPLDSSLAKVTYGFKTSEEAHEFVQKYWDKSEKEQTLAYAAHRRKHGLEYSYPEWMNET